MKYTPFFLSIFMILIGIWVYSGTVGAKPENIGFISAAAWVFILAGLAMGVYTFIAGVSQQHRENLEARYKTSDVRFVESLAGANRETMYLVKLHLSAVLRIYPWAGGWVTVIGSTGVPKGFAAEFLRKSDNTSLASIGAWSDKALWVEPGNPNDFGECRVLAHELTEYLLDIGVAKKSFGNLPPRWVDGVAPPLMRAAWGIPLSMYKDDLSPAHQMTEFKSAEETV